MSSTTATRAKTKRKAPRSTKAGRQIIGALTEIVEAIDSGEPLEARFTVRTVTGPDEPGTYGPAEVLATRTRLGASQAVFARLIGVSLVQVASWERGRREPSGTARRLMDEFNRDPQRWRRVLRPQRRAG